MKRCRCKGGDSGRWRLVQIEEAAFAASKPNPELFCFSTLGPPAVSEDPVSLVGLAISAGGLFGSSVVPRPLAGAFWEVFSGLWETQSPFISISLHYVRCKRNVLGGLLCAPLSNRERPGPTTDRAPAVLLRCDKRITGCWVFRLATVVAVMVVVSGLHDLPGDVVAVLLSEEGAPPIAEWLRDLGAQDAHWPGISVAGYEAGDFVIAFVLETGQT
jgi:hypothetical protein